MTTENCLHIAKRLPAQAPLCPSEGGMPLEKRVGNLKDFVTAMIRGQIDSSFTYAEIYTAIENNMRVAVAEAVAAREDELWKIWLRTCSDDKVLQALDDAKQRHAAELAQVKAAHNQTYHDYATNEKLRTECAVSNALAQERANWQAELAKLRQQRDFCHSDHRTRDQFERAVAAAYEEAAQLVDNGHPFYMSRRQLLVDSIRKLASEPQEATACENEWCIHKHEFHLQCVAKRQDLASFHGHHTGCLCIYCEDARASPKHEKVQAHDPPPARPLWILSFFVGQISEPIL